MNTAIGLFICYYICPKSSNLVIINVCFFMSIAFLKSICCGNHKFGVLIIGIILDAFTGENTENKTGTKNNIGYYFSVPLSWLSFQK